MNPILLDSSDVSQRNTGKKVMSQNCFSLRKTGWADQEVSGDSEFDAQVSKKDERK